MKNVRLATLLIVCGLGLVIAFAPAPPGVQWSADLGRGYLNWTFDILNDGGLHHGYRFGPHHMAWHRTWTLVQVKDNVTCTSGTTCAVTVTSTGSGNLLVAGVMNFGAQTVSSVTAGACSGAWTTPSPSAAFSSGIGSVDMKYCLSSVAAQTSITITGGSAFGTNGVGVIWEFSSNVGSIARDSGATPSGTKSDTTCTACAGVTLTLSGNNNATALLAACGGTCSALTGTGCTNDLANPNGNAIGHCINTTGNLTAPTTWTMTSETLGASAAAFQETAAGASSGFLSKYRKLEHLGGTE